jgi:diguanylate cyclase
MNPSKPLLPVTTAVTRPVPLPEAAAAAPRGQQGVPLGMAGLLLGLGAVLLAAALAYGATLLLPQAPWAAALAAAFGVTLAAAPLGWVVWRLARDLGPSEGRGDAGAELAAGVSRELFMNLAEREFARARRYGTGAALLLVDVDRYARLCEARGPSAGAAVLAELLGQTGPTLRTADVLTHFASAQMAVFLAHADATGALDVAERIRERAEQMDISIDGAQPPQRLRVTVSAGVAHLRPAHLSLSALIDDAQDAVAVARQAGGNCVRAAPVDVTAPGQPGSWRERRARPKQGGPS